MKKKQKKMLRRILIALALYIVLMIVQHLFPLSEMKLIYLPLYLIPYFIVGSDVLRKAVQGIANRQPFDESLLMTIATIGAMVLGEYPEGVAVMLFYQIGEFFQSYAVGKSRRSISALMDIRPDYANLERDGQIAAVDPESVEVGSVILVKPGERVPLDGVVIEGQSALNMAALTGESVPQDVEPGAHVISGSVNLTGVLRLRTEKRYEDSTVARILELVENASMKKAKTENFITRFARWYTPAVVIAAVLLATVPPVVRLAMGITPDWGDWIYRALTFLVISCPCAMVISIPLSFFGGIGGASSRGILVKGSSYLELMANADRVVFDKTGTLTHGTFDVVHLFPAPGVDAQTLLQLAAAAERFSDHPVSLSLQEAAGELPEALAATNAEERSGRGVIAEILGETVAVGNRKLMRELGLDPETVEATGTLVFAARGKEYLGCIEIADRPKENAAGAIRSLKENGVKRIVMLTGDRRAAAEAVAQKIGITEVYSELLRRRRHQRRAGARPRGCGRSDGRDRLGRRHRGRRYRSDGRRPRKARALHAHCAQDHAHRLGKHSLYTDRKGCVFAARRARHCEHVDCDLRRRRRDGALRPERNTGADGPASVTTYEFVTIAIALASIMVSVVLTYLSIKSSNKSTRLISRLMRENSRTTSSEHLSLYRIEAFYNAVAIKNLEFEIKTVELKLKSASLDDCKLLETKLQQLQMNHRFMRIREAKLFQSDLALQEEIKDLFKELKMQ